VRDVCSWLTSEIILNIKEQCTCAAAAVAGTRPSLRLNSVL
jgi:hypothetical protein